MLTTKMRWGRSLAAAFLFLLGGILPAAAQTAPASAAVRTTQQPAARAAAACRGAFVTHELEHITTTDDGVVEMFEGNGAGAALGDLDDDGDLDIVLGAEYGANTVLWNEGGLRFRKTTLGAGPTRGLTVVDVDADGRRDVVLATGKGAVNYWRNVGDGAFARETLPGVAAPAYSLAWGDVDRDGDLDLVTGSYDAGLLTDVGNEYLLAGRGGVYGYENRGGSFSPKRLAREAQALALMVYDISEDGLPDILVGNDFDVPDSTFVQGADGWEDTPLFAHTTHSTMSFDLADLDNDGGVELFASDMKPYAEDEDTMAAWGPMMAEMMPGMEMGEMHTGMHGGMPMMEGDRQVMENVLLARQGGEYRNAAAEWGVDGTGWSWAGRFGDLDQDGYVDLYVVNGMIEATMFGYLPGHELIEENQAFRNGGGAGFVPMPEWGLNELYSGRSAVLGDLDGDGDLDVVVNNLRGPAQLFENQVCGGQSVQVALRWPGAHNRDAVGARLRLVTTAGPMARDVRLAGGYLSGDAARVHFGVPAGHLPLRLEIVWPDGATSLVEKGLELDSLLVVERLE